MHSGSALKAAALLLESDYTGDIVEGSCWHDAGHPVHSAYLSICFKAVAGPLCVDETQAD